VVKYQVCTINELRDEDRPGELWIYLGDTGGDYHLIRRAGTTQCRLVRLKNIAAEGFIRNPHLDSEVACESRGGAPKSPGEAPDAGYADW